MCSFLKSHLSDSKNSIFQKKKKVIRGRSIPNANARFLSYDGVRGREMNQDLILQGGHNENKIIVVLVYYNFVLKIFT